MLLRHKFLVLGFLLGILLGSFAHYSWKELQKARLIDYAISIEGPIPGVPACVVLPPEEARSLLSETPTPDASVIGCPMARQLVIIP